MRAQTTYLLVLSPTEHIELQPEMDPCETKPALGQGPPV